VTAAVRDWIGEQVSQQPELTLEELQQRLEQGQGLRLSLSWIWVLLRQLGLRLKKNRSTPRSRIAKRPSGAGKSGSKKLPR
jgi:transposase